MICFQIRLGRASICRDKYVKFVCTYTQIEWRDERNNSVCVTTCLEQEYSKRYRPLNSTVYQNVNSKLGRVGKGRRTEALIERAVELQKGSAEDGRAGSAQGKQ